MELNKMREMTDIELTTELEKMKKKNFQSEIPACNRTA